MSAEEEKTALEDLKTAVFIMERLVQQVGASADEETVAQAYKFLKKHPFPGSYADQARQDELLRLRARLAADVAAPYMIKMKESERQALRTHITELEEDQARQAYILRAKGNNL